MTVLFMTGFDADTGAVSGTPLSGTLASRWTGTWGGTPSADLVDAAPRSKLGLRASGSNGWLRRSLGSNLTGAGVIGFAVRTSNLVTSRVLFGVMDGENEQISVRTNASAVLIVSRAGTTVATGSTVLQLNTWYYIELKFTISATAGTVELHLNGAVEIPSTTGLNTRNTANAQWNGVGPWLAGDWSVFDDIYVLDASTPPNNDFLGPVSIVALRPAGPGSSTQWTSNGAPNWAAVTDSQDDDASFVAATTGGAVDLYAMTDPPASSGTVYAVQHLIRARQDTGAQRTIQPALKIGANTYFGAAINTGSGWTTYAQILDYSPATSSPWTLSELAALEAGIKLLS
jgi:hypothetical protein